MEPFRYVSGDGRAMARILARLGIPFPFGVIWIRISDLNVTQIMVYPERTDDSTLVTHSSIPLMYHDPERSWITDPDQDKPMARTNELDLPPKRT